MPDAEIVVIEHDLADADIAARFSLDEVRRAEVLDWCQGICRDGPLAGALVYVTNRLASKVLARSPVQPGGALVEYEVTRTPVTGLRRNCVSPGPER